MAHQSEGRRLLKLLGHDYRCGQRVALALSDYLGQHAVMCDWAKLDRYGRKLAHCTVAGQDAGL